MITVASEVVRELPVSPIVFGAFAFSVFVVLLYLVLRLDKYFFWHDLVSTVGHLIPFT